MHSPLFYRYYDAIYSVKDYKSETEILLQLYRSMYGHFPQRLLDVGCGTGSHSCHFAASGCAVVGTDIDSEEIQIAMKKSLALPDPRPRFYCMDIAQLQETGFDLGVSLFNVVSYIRGIENLSVFLGSIHRKLRRGGLFVFDCWNGLAVLTDPPKEKRSRIEADGCSFELELSPTVDLLQQVVVVRNRVTVHSASPDVEEFEFSYSQFLWTPAILRDILTYCGFEIVSVSPTMKPREQATAETWKIMFVCKKP
jgi:SAM-dependent methyltransferase